VVLAGSGGLTVSSPDARLWTQATYTGATTVTSGQLNICGVGGISTSSAVSIASGATVYLTSFYAADNINRTIGGLTGAGVLHGNGGTVTVNKSSGTDIFSGVIQGGQGLIKDGAGTLVLAGNNTYSGATLVSGGTLVVTNSTFTATILPASTTVNFATPPVVGTTNNVLSGPLNSASLFSKNVTGLSSNTVGILTNNPNLQVIVTARPTGPTFEGTYGSNDPLAVNPANGLSYLMNYALGGTGPNSTPALPVLTVGGDGLTLTATVRNDDPSLRFYGQWTTDLSGTTDSWEDHTVELTPPNLSFSQDVESGKPRKFMRFKVTKIP
jgi:autotransporter-associated beta strand protein